MKLIKYVIIVSVLYLFFHNPIFTFLGGMGSIKIIDFLSIFLLLLYSKKKLHFLSVFKREFVVLFLILLFTLFRAVLGGDSDYIRSMMVAIIEIMVVPASIVFLINDIFSVNESGFKRAILITGFVGSIISCLCIINPSFGNFVKFQLQLLGDNLEEVTWRGFGISEALTSSYGYIQGLIIVLGTLYLKDNKWFIIAYPFVFASTILNARTGVVIAAFGLLFFVLTTKNKKKFTTILLGGVAALFISYVIIQYIQKAYSIDEGVYIYAQTLFDELSGMESDRSIHGSATLDTMLGQMIVMPGSLEEWIIGRGHSIMGTGTRITSDIGFIIQLNYGGLIYFSLLIYFILVLIKRMRFYHIESTFVLLFIITFVICNFKGDMLPNTGIFRFLMLLYIYFILDKKHLLKC